MPTADENDAFESAVSRLPFPVFVVDSNSRLRAMNAQARQVGAAERLDESLLERAPHHPLSRIIAALRQPSSGDAETSVLQFEDGRRYEVIHSTRSPKGGERWLMLILRPFPTAATVNQVALRKQWSLTPREAEVAAACIAGRTSAEICEQLSISRETLKTHMARLLDKADCDSRSQLVAKYLFRE
jgi:DNA-binding CsgD family transcriptional regulator